jgi:hypothetical protein
MVGTKVWEGVAEQKVAKMLHKDSLEVWGGVETSQSIFQLQKLLLYPGRPL